MLLLVHLLRYQESRQGTLGRVHIHVVKNLALGKLVCHPELLVVNERVVAQLRECALKVIEGIAEPGDEDRPSK